MPFPRSSSANGHHHHGHPLGATPSFLDEYYSGAESANRVSPPPSDSTFLPITDQHLRVAVSTTTSRTMSAYNGSNEDSQHPGSLSPSAYIGLQQSVNANRLQNYYQQGGVRTSNINPSHYTHPMSTTSTNHSLSPGSASAYNKTTPSTGVIGDPIEGYDGISKHTTPSFDDDILGADVDLSPSMDGAEFQQSSGDVEMQSFQTEALISNGSPSNRRNSSTDPSGSVYVPSPMNAHMPSPSSRGETYRHFSAGSAPFIGVASTPSKSKPRTTLQIPDTELSFAGGHSNSNGGAGGSTTDAHPASAHLRSPVVKVEHVSGEDSPPDEPFLGRGLGKRTRAVDTSHLAPRQDEFDSSEDEMADDPDQPVSPVQGFPATRDIDGSWLPSAKTGQAGLNPEMRKSLQDILVPTLQEQEKDRQIAERNAEVADWLQRSQSTIGVAGLPPSPSTKALRKQKSGRRRARSMGDVPGFRPDLLGSPAGDEAGIPGPGVLVNEDSEDDGEEYSSELVEDEDSSMVGTSPPASVHANDALEETQRELSMATLADPEAADPEEPLPHQFCRARPWRDTPPSAGPSSSRYQPANSNAAMMLFNQVADNYDTASRVATWGTRRRLSEADLDQIGGPRALLKRLSFGKDKDKDKKKSDQRGNFLDMADVKKKLMPRISAGNSKRRASDKDQPFRGIEHTDSTISKTTSISPARVASFGKPKLNTGGAVAAMAGQFAVIGGGAGSMSATSINSAGPWAQAKQFVKRNRSRSDSGRKSSLSILMTQHGGPPMPTLASPARVDDIRMPGNGDNEDEDDDECEEEMIDDKGVTMDLKIRHDSIIPTFQGFQTHVKQLNPRLSPSLVERISHEQVRRFKKLVDFRTKHLSAVKNHKCSSGRFCFALGGDAVILPPKANGRDPEATFAGFQVSASHSEEETVFGEGAVAAAQFPQGVPLPPVKRLPAEFECPLCFKVKKFQKPSDWTKHVHEDVQPFTCTFHNCSEPKSFKRKADWVRHENERHRQLEWWTCNLPDCSHTCYRKDNFVQHLVREHKKPEPKVKATKAAMKATAAAKGRGSISQGGSAGRWQSANGVADADPHQEEIDRVWQLVEDCHHDTDKQPREEPCRFCGNICSSWKKLTVHLARHMEQISLPVLALVEQKNTMAGLTVSSVEQQEPIRVMTPVHPHSWGGSPVAIPFTMRGSVSPVGMLDPPYTPLEGQGTYFAPNAGGPVSNYVPQGPHYPAQSPVPDPMGAYPDHTGGGFTTSTFQNYGQSFSPSDNTGTYTGLSPNHSYAGFEPIPGQTLGLPVGDYSSPDIPVTPYNGQSIFPSTMEQVPSYTTIAPEMHGTGISPDYQPRMGGMSFVPAENEPSPTSTYMQQQPQNFYEH